MGRSSDIRRGYLVAVAASVLAVLIVQIALARSGASAEAPQATASAVTDAKFNKLKRQVAALKKQVNTLQRTPGPRGLQGPPGEPPPCEGNDATDVMVEAGAVCIDRYEASIWSSPTGGTQYGVTADDYPCSDNGQDCEGEIFARSVAGVAPSRAATYFQAQAALANAGKRLPTSDEWQQAAIGTPDPGASPGSEDCNTSSGVTEPAGERANCISQFGANDMVGNAFEIVADWGSRATSSCAPWFASDASCVSEAGSVTSSPPGLFLRGGSRTGGADAGVFAINVQGTLSDAPNLTVGFRGAR